MLKIEPKKIVVGVTAHDSCDAVLEYAASEATRRGCGVHLVLVEQPLWKGAHNQSEVALFGDELRLADTTFLSACARRVSSRLSGPGVVSSEIVHGPVAASLCRVAENSEMVALEHHRMGHAFHLPTLSVTNGVASRAPVPVVAVPDGWHESEQPTGLVVAGIEGGDGGLAVAEAAFDEARRLRSGARLVHVWSWSDDQDETDQLIRTSSAIDRTALLRERLSAELGALTGQYPDVEHEVVAVYGQPAYVLMGESAQARLLVLGRHAPRFRFGSHLGPITRTVITYAHCPVLVVDPRVSSDSPGTVTTRGASLQS